jgi:pyruvate dehydrogenase E2 component (dihydrolipoamide acetyltransferase)
VDLDGVVGSGPDGRITGDDVEAAARGENRIVAVTASIAADEIPVSAIRRTIAANLTAVAAIPRVTTFRTVDCTELDALRRELDVSPLPVFLAALARVLRDHRTLNSVWHDDRILVFHNMHAGVATDTGRGLVVPVVRDLQDRGIADIAAETTRLAEAARAGTLRPEEMAGSTITVTNTGSYGSESGTPLLNPGNAVTVALGAIAPRALVVDGEVMARPACTISLTFDHRVLDGAVVGRALNDLVACLQESERLRDLTR